ncbi:MAG: T9SS type A sorting domain-containing protein [Bacteroidales bacterium]|nr:T9SS type A sorting domain-containing protein [Bacteroidales bacterium]
MKNIPVFTLILLMPWLLQAQTLKTSVFSSGGGASQSAGYNHFGTFGQPLSVGALGTNYQTREGFIFAQQNELTNSVSADQEMCPNTEIETLISVNEHAEGELAYQWQQLVGGNWQNIAGATGATYTPDPPIETTLFRMLAIDKSGVGTVESNPVTITIHSANDYFEIPNPWLAANTHASANGTSVYAPCNNDGTFLLTATGKSTTTSDVFHFVYQELCSTQATVIAHLDEVENGGWGGVMMRENTTPGAKTILFKTRLYNPNVIIGYRTTTNKSMRNLSQVAQMVRWMKIQRNGNNFKVFTSYNGTTWQQRYSGTIYMGDCILAGIFTESVLASRTSKAWLDHVVADGSLKTGTELATTEIIDSSEAPESILVYPNPANDVLNIVVGTSTDGLFPAAQSFMEFRSASLLSAEGRLVKTIPITNTTNQLAVDDLKPGIYILKIRWEKEMIIKKIVIQ